MVTIRRHTVNVLTALVLAGSTIAAAPPAPSRARVDTLTLREGAAPVVELGLSRPVEPAMHRLANPPRAYVDLADTVVGPSVARVLDGTGAITRVRLGQFDAQTVRVVIELAAAASIEVQHAGSTLRLAIATGSPSPRAAVPPVSSVAPAKAAAAAHSPVAPPSPTLASQAVAPVAPPQAAAVGTAPIDMPRLTVVHADEPLLRASKPSQSPALSATLQERIARRYAAEDWPGIVALYANDPHAMRRGADATTRAAVADALRELGLVYSAQKVLGPASSGEAPSVRVARAELALASGDSAEATSLVSGLDDAAVDPMLVPKLGRVRVRLAMARGDLDAAAARIGNRANPELRAELAHAAIVAGRTASDEGGCRRALVAFRQALDADGGRTARTAAGAGLVRAALACGDPEATMTGLGVLAESPHPLLRRAATVIATTQTDEKRRQTARPTKQGG